MYVSPTSTAAQAQSTAQGSAASIDYNTFLKLLVAEMKNQDPTNPMDATQYVAQLASFSQVEQSVQINQKLESLIQASALQQTDKLIGYRITSADGATSGIVKEVKLYSDGLMAILEDGKQVPVVPGVTIGEAGGAS